MTLINGDLTPINAIVIPGEDPGSRYSTALVGVEATDLQIPPRAGVRLLFGGTFGL